MSSDTTAAGALIWLIAIVILIVAARRQRRARHRGVGSAAAGAVYDWLNEDKRRAVEIIVEKRAEARDAEDRDGNLPQLAGPHSRTTG